MLSAMIIDMLIRGKFQFGCQCLSLVGHILGDGTQTWNIYIVL